MIVINMFFGLIVGLILSATSAANVEVRGMNAEAKTDVNAIHAHLEMYYAENGGYPNNDLTNKNFGKGLDPVALINPAGKPITELFSTSSSKPAIDENAKTYVYHAYGCKHDKAQGSDTPACQKYILYTGLQNEPTYTKESLN